MLNVKFLVLSGAIIAASIFPNLSYANEDWRLSWYYINNYSAPYAHWYNEADSGIFRPTGDFWTYGEPDCRVLGNCINTTGMKEAHHARKNKDGSIDLY